MNIHSYIEEIARKMTMQHCTRPGDECESSDRGQARIDTVQECLLDEPTASRLAQTFKAFCDPTRVRILSALSHSELCVHELAECLGMSQSAISHQLRTLREMRLVRFRREGRHVHYVLNDEHIFVLLQCGLQHVQHG